MTNALFHLLILPGIIYILTEASNPTSALDPDEDRVYHGQPVDPPHSRPYVVQVPLTPQGYTFNFNHGIIYDEYTVITATANVVYYSTYDVIAGKYYFDKVENTTQTRKSCKLSVSINNEGINDWAIIHLKEPFVFNAYVQPIRLAPPGAETPTTKCSLIGWGRTEEGEARDSLDVLRETAVTFMDPSKCYHAHPTVSCIDMGACWWDMGAPVVCDLDGVPTAYAYARLTPSNCRESTMPWIPALQREWLLGEIELANTICNRPARPTPAPTTLPPPRPPTTPPTPTPPPPPPPPPGKCECRLKGYCKMYFECVNYPNNTAGWEYRGNCTGNLYWNSNDVTGGFCDYFQNLPPELQTKYRSDPTCMHCDWFQELSDVCSPRYTFRDTNLVEHKMSCPASPTGKDPLYWQLNTKSCDLCYNAVDYHGVACQCKK